MEVGRLYNKEKQFLVVVFSSILALLLGIISIFIIKNRTSPLERAVLKSDYREIYKYIRDPDFTESVFKAYMEYNFGKKIDILEKNKSKYALEYKINGVNGIKKINLVKDKEYIWNFDDYTYNWTINASKGTSIFIEDKEYKAVDGIVEIPRIPFGVYSLKAGLKGCSDYETRIMAGQSIQIKMELSEETIERCSDTIREYIKFKENAINTRQIGEIGCLSKDSGLYKELLEEIQWLKKQDFKAERKLVDLVIKKGFMEDNSIAVDTAEKWEIYIKSDGNESKKIEEYNNRYIISPGEKYIINQIKTINQ